MKQYIKRIPWLYSISRYIRRVLFRSKYIYFLSHSAKPLSNYYGFDRGKPLDRYYIEQFLQKNKKDIAGNCLELLNNTYTVQYGEDRVTQSDILDIEETNKKATIIDDLRTLDTVADATYQCIILTQVFQFIDNLDAAIAQCHRVLKSGGVLLVTLPSISRIDCTSGVEGDYWRFTKASARYLFTKQFVSDQLTIESYGNVRAGIYFYAGLAQEDTPKSIYKKNDPQFPLLITVRAEKI